MVARLVYLSASGLTHKVGGASVVEKVVPVATNYSYINTPFRATLLLAIPVRILSLVAGTRSRGYAVKKCETNATIVIHDLGMHAHAPRRKPGIQRLLQRCSEGAKGQPTRLQPAGGASEVPDSEARRHREQSDHGTCTRRFAAPCMPMRYATIFKFQCLCVG